jgi:hypothetical protein
MHLAENFVEISYQFAKNNINEILFLELKYMFIKSIDGQMNKQIIFNDFNFILKIYI